MSSCSTLDQQYKTFLSDPSTKNFPSSHRTKCSQSDYALKYFHGNNPPKIRRKFTKNDFALKYFDILRANLSHETNRKKVESFLILLHTPNINKQKDFTKFHTLQSSTVFGQLGARLKSTILIFKTFSVQLAIFHFALSQK